MLMALVATPDLAAELRTAAIASARLSAGCDDRDVARRCGCRVADQGERSALHV